MGGISVYAPVSISQQGSDGSINQANATGTAKQLQAIVQQTITERLKKKCPRAACFIRGGHSDGHVYLADEKNSAGY